MPFIHGFTSAGAGFLLAVLWFDLMFDEQVRRQSDGPLPVEILASISGYYRRVTAEAWPMNRLVAGVMLLTLLSIIVEIVASTEHRWIGWTSLLAAASAIGLAGVRTVPNAMRLGREVDSIATRSDLARTIYRDHVFCFAAIASLLLLQLSTLL